MLGMATSRTLGVVWEVSRWDADLHIVIAAVVAGGSHCYRAGVNLTKVRGMRQRSLEMSPIGVMFGPGCKPERRRSGHTLAFHASLQMLSLQWFCIDVQRRSHRCGDTVENVRTYWLNGRTKLSQDSMPMALSLEAEIAKQPPVSVKSYSEILSSSLTI